MYPSVEEILKTIGDAFPGATVTPLEGEPGPKSDWVIRWTSFHDMPDRERHLLVRRRVRDRMGIKGQALRALIPLAPGESPY